MRKSESMPPSSTAVCAAFAALLAVLRLAPREGARTQLQAQHRPASGVGAPPHGLAHGRRSARHRWSHKKTATAVAVAARPVAGRGTGILGGLA